MGQVLYPLKEEGRARPWVGAATLKARQTRAASRNGNSLCNIAMRPPVGRVGRGPAVPAVPDLSKTNAPINMIYPLSSGHIARRALAKASSSIKASTTERPRFLAKFSMLVFT